MIGRVFAMLATVCALVAGGPALAADVPPPAGRIFFDVHYGSQGFKVGQASHTWRYDGARYDLSLTLEAKGLAGLFGLEYAQRSVGTREADGLRPERFSVEQRGRKPESAHFDWAQGRVSVRRAGQERKSGEIRAGDQDVLSLWHQARRVAQGGKPVELTVVTNKSIKKARLEPLGSERLKLALGELDTVRLHARADKGELDITIWLSPRHGLLPVRIRIEDEKGGVLDQRASRIELGAQADARNTN